MLLTGIDLETTGLDPDKGHRIVEIAMLTYDTDSRELVDSYIQRFNPERPIDTEAQAIHGICFEDLVGCPKFTDKAGEIFDRLNNADFLLAHNLAFDAPFVGSELVAAGKGIPDIGGICTMENGRWACADGKLPNLGELCFALGVEYDVAKAHGAEYDIQVAIECFFKGLDRGFYELPAVSVRAKLKEAA
jgi:DNA polymerase-3 subunit epsilon